MGGLPTLLELVHDKETREKQSLPETDGLVAGTRYWILVVLLGNEDGRTGASVGFRCRVDGTGPERRPSNLDTLFYRSHC
jgi:hypothetical protein